MPKEDDGGNRAGRAQWSATKETFVRRKGKGKRGESGARRHWAGKYWTPKRGADRQVEETGGKRRRHGGNVLTLGRCTNQQQRKRVLRTKQRGLGSSTAGVLWTGDLGLKNGVQVELDGARGRGTERFLRS